MRKYEVTINEKNYSVLVKSFSADDAELEINGKAYSVKMDGPIKTITSGGQMIGSVAPPQQQSYQAPASPTPAPQPPASQSAVNRTAPPAPAPATSGSGEAVTAPIPGSILEILVGVGDTVEIGQTLVKMEAMKMENEINATASGKISAIHVSIGDAVNQGQKLVEIG